jgi:hypothetical protein
MDSDVLDPSEIRALASKRIARNDARLLAQKHTPAAIRYLASLLKDDSAAHSDRLRAARELLDRAWGRPAEDHTHRLANDSAPLRVRWMTSADDD